jgi:hypothetical protein
MNHTRLKTEAVVMIDLDGNWQAFLFQVSNRFNMLADKLWPGTLWRVQYQRSPSGKGWHFWARAKNRKFLPALEVILVQALCESDIRRERGNFYNLMNGTKNWNRLFSTKRVPIQKKTKKYLTARKKEL